MQTLDFTNALNEIAEQLLLKDLLATIEPFLQRAQVPITSDQKKHFTRLLIKSNAAYQFLLKQESTRAVLDKSQLGELLEDARMSELINTLHGVPNTQHMWNNLELYREFYHVTELIKSFLRMQTTAKELLETPKIGKLPENESLIEVELMEEAEDHGVAPERVQILVSALIETHTVMAKLYGVTDDKLTFRYFDSGTNVAAGASCATAIAEAMKAFFSLALSVRFWNQETFDRRILSFSNALDLAKKIDQNVADGVMTPEEGQHCKTTLFEQAQKVTRIGAAIPSRVAGEQRQLHAFTSLNLLQGNSETSNG